MSQSKHKSPPERLRRPNDNHTLWILRRVWDRVNKDNEHFMGCIVGREGAGKSYTALKIADELDPTFNADRVIFDVAELLRILKDGDHSPGNFYVLDEAGVQLGTRTWQDRAQILANQALQLIRNHNLGLIFTLPRLSELDSQGRGRLQAVLEIVEKEADEWVKVKWKWMDPNRTDDRGNILQKYPRRREDGHLKRITRNTFAPPEGDFIEEYEERKRTFQEDFYEETIEAMSDEEEQADDGPSLQEIADDILGNGVGEYVARHNRNKTVYVDKDLIRAEKDLSHSDANTVKKLIERELSETELEELAS